MDKTFPDVIDAQALLSYLVYDLHLFDVNKSRPGRGNYYKINNRRLTMCSKLAQIFDHPVLLEDGLVVTYRQTGIQNDIHTVVSNIPTTSNLVIAPTRWHNADTVRAHAGITIIDPVNRTFHTWDPAGSIVWHQQSLLSRHMNHAPQRTGRPWASNHSMQMTRPFIQSVLESTNDGTLAYEHDLCAILSTLVLLCALRFNNHNLWLISDSIVAILLRMNRITRGTFTTNAVWLFRRLINRNTDMDRFLSYIGILHPRERRTVSKCAILYDIRGETKICQNNSRHNCVFCDEHYELMLAYDYYLTVKRQPQFPTPIDADDPYDRCQHRNRDSGQKTCPLEAISTTHPFCIKHTMKDCPITGPKAKRMRYS